MHARAIALFLALFIFPSWSWSAGPCPPGSRAIAVNGGYMCRCPDGTWASYGVPCARQQENVVWCSQTAYCQQGQTCCGDRCCSRGSYCSKYGCTPDGAVDCGTGYCNPGQKCASGNRCIDQGADDCGDRRSCGPGFKCAGESNCVVDEAYCGPECHCKPGYKASQFIKGCVSKESVDCGYGYSCDSGLVCVGKRECITPGEAVRRGATAAARVNIEKEHNRTVVEIYMNELATVPVEVAAALINPADYALSGVVGKWAEQAGI